MKVAMNHEVKDWLRKLKDVAYDIEDVLDEFATEALRQKVELPNNMIVKQVRRCFSRSNPLVFRLQMANRIKDIIERLDRIQKDDVRAKSQFTTQSVDMEINNDFRRHTNSVVIGSEVLGREKDKENLVELLTSGGNQENVMVIPIVGIGGLGKTTLAQYVYNDERVKTHFDLQMWVCVSFNFNVANIAKKILENQSESELKEKLSKKRYLLVLDDVWNEHPGKWEDLRKLLIGEASGSMILVTTRSQEVASIMRPIKSFYPLEGLNETDCESLFNERAFGKGKETNYPELVEIGKAIVKKCGGVPLAAKALGSLLCLKRYKKDWLDVLHTEIWNLGEQEREILPALRISYNHLPSHLKQCFAYCSLFPQDHEIDVGDLIHQWMAQGFIQPPLRGSHVTLEDIGNRYFRELLWRSFFQEVREDRFGNIKECKMHDLVHSLARWVAGIEWSEVDSGNRPISIPEGVRHMVVRGKEGDVLNHQTLITFDRAQKLRTLYLQGDEFNELGISSGFVSSLRGLRVLKLRDLGMRHVPSSIGYLEQLRYLDLSGNDFEALPNSICRLYNLQTLRLEYCTSFDEWPRDMTKLVCLRHLELKSKFAMKYMPCGLGQLASLQTLGYFIVGDSNDRRKRSLKKVMGGLGELHGLNQLQGFLCIDGLGNVRDARDAEEAKLKDKSELQSLKLCWLTECSRLPLEDEQVFENLQPHPNLKELKICNYEGIKMPRWMTLSSSLLPNIVELQIFDCSNLKCLPLIGEFPCLRHLSLFSLNSLESICNRLVVRGNKGAVEGGNH
ncbi:putative disease resistance protein RGA3 isoform X2 [Macadamia integrifolia]|nr:putative disease resistance protein RGA3 isoform X2 [Macadamia integrifolia]